MKEEMAAVLMEEMQIDMHKSLRIDANTKHGQNHKREKSIAA